jgi:uncharacterized protein (DUF305 family)
MSLKTLFGAAALAAVVSVSFSASVAAQAQHHGHHGHAPAAQAPALPEETEATRAFREINDIMHRDMNIAFTNDVDIDFVRGMIPHHEGAVAMAKVVLEHSQDEELRELAQEVVDAQEKEIAFMRAYLARRGVD